MTTDANHRTPGQGGRVLLGAAAASAVPLVLLVALGAFVSGAPAAYGALAGGLLVLVVLGFGAGTVDVVSRVMPAASLLVATLTYTLQVAVMLLAFVVLTRSGLLDDALDRNWLGGAVITGTAAWLVAQIVLTMRARIPAYEAGAR